MLVAAKSMVYLGIRNQFCRSHQRLCRGARPKSRPAPVSMFDALEEPPQEAYASSFYISVQTGGKGRGTPPCTGPLLCFINVSSFFLFSASLFILYTTSAVISPESLAPGNYLLQSPFQALTLQALVDQRRVWILWWCWRERSEGLGRRNLFPFCLGSKFLNSNIFQL